MIYETKKFKDGQVTAKIIGTGNLHVKIRGNNYEDLFRAASIKEAWDNENVTSKGLSSILTIYCLIGQRSDRRFNESESFDLKVISRFINTMNFDRVELFHPHSSVALALINNSKELNSYKFIKMAYEEIGAPILVSPDAGAYKNTHKIAEILKTDLIPSNKIRINGKPKIEIQGNIKGRDCLIVDDIADGGRTFKDLAKALKNLGASKVFLYVSHAQFNYGFDELKEYIDHIFCTNSYRDIEEAIITQYKVI
ncbi:phosphoribosyltransferase family protein [Gaetbulibacter jejuensis]|uniref:Phosphoribosyltransferase domain-containing protein n=1 Tax=Gaetbulibacter jejuensis TaxID=584607 RepID=A0ABN1JF06_9FLAO